MKILYLINGLNGGGASFPLPDLAIAARARGHELKVAALMPQDRRACARLDAAGIDWQLIGSGPGDVLGAYARLSKLVSKQQPDLIWTSLSRATLFGQLAGRQHGIPVVSWQHNAYLKPGNRRLLRLTKSLSAFWIADSDSVREFACRELGLSDDAVERWPLFRASADAQQARACASVAMFRFGSLGRLHPNKRYGDLIEAALQVRARWPALARQVEFLIAGSGPEQAALQARIDAAGLDNVRLVGFIEDPACFLAGLHAYIQPSHHEGLGIAAHEAMQAGLPVIATRVGELARSIVHGETGYLCDVGDVKAMADAITRLADHRQSAATMGRQSRDRILERFGQEAWDQAADRVLGRMEAVVSASKQAKR